MKKLILPPKLCLVCRTSFDRSSCKSVTDFKVKKYCSRGCFFKGNSGKNHPLWKGGTKTRPDGYVRDSKTDRYVHRLVMEKKLGRRLLNTEHVHHKDGNKKNNKISNLQLVSNSEHRKIEIHYATRDKQGRFA